MYPWLLADRNAVGRDVLDESNSRFRGSMDAIQKWVNGFDYMFQCFVTFVGYGIICAAIGKNCLAGLYCAFPKFFDKVDAAHKEHENEGWIDSIIGLKSSYRNINGASIGKFFLRLIPNIKSITDFEDATVSAKDYFLKAIPLMCVAIIIGGFIYNGFHADTGAKITDFGSELFYRTIMATDPIEVFDRVTDAVNRPTFSADGSDAESDKMVAEICEKAYAAIKSRWNDIQGKTTVANLSSNIESWVVDSIKKCKLNPYQVLENDPEGYKWDVDVKIVEKQLDVEAYNRETMVDERKTIMGSDSIDIMDTLGVRDMTAKDDQEQHFLMYIVKLTAVSKKDKIGSCNDIVLTAYYKQSNGKYIINLTPTGSNGSWNIASVLNISFDGTTVPFSYKSNQLTVDKDTLDKAVKKLANAQGTPQKMKWLSSGAAPSTISKIVFKSGTNNPTWKSTTYNIGNAPGEIDKFTQKESKDK